MSIAAHTLLVQQHGDKAGPHLNGINALFGAGSLLAPVLHRALAAPLAHVGPLASYWVVSAAALVAAVPFLLTRPRRTAPGRAHAPPAAAWSWSRRSVGAVAAAMLLVACNVGVRSLPLPPLPPRCSSVLQAENCFGTWLYTHARSLPGGPMAAATAVSLFWGSFTAGRLLAIPVSARASPAAVLLCSLPLAALGPALMLLSPSTAALYAGAALAGLGISTGFANSVTLLARLVPPSGGVQACIQVAATAGSITFPPAVALIAQRGAMGVESFLYIACACVLLDIILVVLLDGMR